MGNIDEPGTEAYNRFGAGRGRAAPAAPAVAPAAPAAPAAPSMPAASSTPLSDDMYSDFGPSAGRSSSETVKPTRPMATKPVVPARQPARPPAMPVPPLSNAGPDRSSLINKPSLNPNFSNEGRTKPAPASSAASQIPGSSSKAPQGEKIDSSETSRNLENAATALGVGAGAAGLYKLGSKLFKGGKKAAEKVSPFIKEIGMDKKKLSGPRKASDVTDVTAKKRGGAVKKYASGGMVSSASRRADGIAIKGKTRGKMC
jgi:hypothetical protein